MISTIVVVTIVVVTIVLVCGAAILVGVLVLRADISHSKKQKTNASKQPAISTQRIDTVSEGFTRESTASQPDGNYKRCPSCGHNNPPTHNFCEQCGVRL